MKLENDLDTDDIRGLVLRLALPSMLAQFVSVFYSIVDRMYIGNIPKIGEVALAGVGICGPIVTLVSSFAILVGVGGAPLMSIRLGQKNEKGARQILANCFLMLTVMALVLTVFVLGMREKLLWWFGAGETTFPYALSYMTIYLCGTFFALMTTGMNQFIICQGFARIGMISVALGAVTNIVLDPVFIFVFDMGVAGAAFATVLSQFASAAFVLRFLRGNRVLLRLEFECPQVKTVCKIALMGLSPFLIIAFDNVLIISLNTVIQMYGGAEADMLLTCTTIVQSFMLIVTMPLGGITSGTGAILGFNFGAGRPDRIRSAQKYITLLAVVQCCIMFLFSRTLAQYFVYLFTRNESYVELTVWAIRVYTMGIIPLAVQYEVVDGFTGMGVPSVAISLSMFRKLLYLVSVFLIPVFAGVENVFYAEVVSDFGGTTVSVIVYLLLIGRIMGRCVERAKWNGNSDNTVINQ